MKRLITGLILLNSLSPAFADITDLPDPGQVTETYTSTQRGSLVIQNISRKTGGEKVQITLKNPLPIANFEIYVSNESVKIYSAHFSTTEGQKIPVRAFSETGKLEPKSLYTSEVLNSKDVVASIELEIEAFGSNAEIQFMAYANTGLPVLSINRQPVPQKPVQEAKPSQPKPRPKPKPAPPTERAFKVDDVVGFSTYYGQIDIGRIREIYENDKYLVEASADDKRVLAKQDLTLITRCNAEKQLCTDSAIYYKGNYSFEDGKVFGHFGSKYVIVRSSTEENYIYFIAPNKVYPKTDCSSKYNLCVGARVLSTASNELLRKGRVTRVLPNDTFDVQQEGYSLNFRGNELYRDKETLCAESLCVGNRGLFISGSGYYYYTGIVQKIWDNKLVQFKSDEGTTLFVPASSISKAK
ncbi:beta-sandwich domain-containing protein [Bdellovibrio sp. HCB2-146]|uniref:beta-sandwich domain-containing protein n=1 Tax=Bdellovibrio sp. HCB2-146 TaxID=3394362 RepID=UPI0039BC9166